ncbi:cupredoxin domain-containing protein [Burkholderia sp. S171]|uniref:cupredoxin domain-containing protein n=1 Tax=Burkholderia sp. S171 TaxID=1641860 RepID=UPI0020B108FE|nr:cupredoxin domain-containing protein [Burkholderia sp. S171]
MPDFQGVWIAKTVAKTIAALCFATALAATSAFAAEAKPAATVVIDNFSFSPAQLSVAAGSTVTWENHDDMPHTIVNDATPREFKSAPLDSGEHFSQTFAKPGTYKYFCSIHPHMTGTIVVK